MSPSPKSIQRLPDFITSRLNRYARHIPGYVLFTVIIGFNPLTGRSVARTPENLLGGLMGVLGLTLDIGTSMVAVVAIV